MTGLMLVGIALVWFACAYLFYGRWLAKTWGIDPKAPTPAVRKNDGQDYSPASRFTVFAHQFSSITGAGPVTGPIIAAMFGWLPAFLWILIGGAFFGAVQDFTALYASVKNEGKSMGLLIEQYVGRTGRRLPAIQLALHAAPSSRFLPISSRRRSTAWRQRHAQQISRAHRPLRFPCLHRRRHGLRHSISKARLSASCVHRCRRVVIDVRGRRELPAYFDAPTRYIVFGYRRRSRPADVAARAARLLELFLPRSRGAIGDPAATRPSTCAGLRRFRKSMASRRSRSFITTPAALSSRLPQPIPARSRRPSPRDGAYAAVGYGAMFCECMLGRLAIACAAARMVSWHRARCSDPAVGISTFFTNIFACRTASPPASSRCAYQHSA